MNKRGFHLLLLCCLLGLSGCVEPIYWQDDPGLVLTLRCDDAILTKGDPSPKEGVRQFNENLVKSVDFLFYRGANPSADQDAVYHVRKEWDDESQHSIARYNLVLNKIQFENLFPPPSDYSADSVAVTVYALVNFEDSFNDLSQTSRNDLEGRDPITTDFAALETNYIMPQFLMDGRAVLKYKYKATDPDQTVKGEIPVQRFAAKLTMGVRVAPQVRLQHSTGDNQDPPADEYWEPVRHTMEVYLVDGVKTMKLTPDGLDDRHVTSKFFNYKNNRNKRPYLTENEEAYVDSVEYAGNYYLETFPMYSYPRAWTDEQWNYQDIDFLTTPPEQPYFKVEMDWKRLEVNGYSYDRRKYYYKVFLPFNSFERNRWYDFYLDVSILGAETDEGKATITPSCYVLDWQNKAVSVNKRAVISKARYLAVDVDTLQVRNQNTAAIAFMSSHNVRIILDSVTATRPYYGKHGADKLNKYDTELHAWIRKKQNKEEYYLEYNGQPSESAGGDPAYEPKYWLTNTTTSIQLDHVLQNSYTRKDFDYSPYTIQFKIVHDDLTNPRTDLYKQYRRVLTIIQYPAIYIEATQNSDVWIQKLNVSGKPYGYPNGYGEWPEEPWGFVLIDGDQGRHIRVDQLDTLHSADPFFQLKSEKDKREYQWRTVWYTGGSRNMFKINVTVLPASSTLVIGDPRTDEVDNLDYSFTLGDERDLSIIGYSSRSGFCYARDVNNSQVLRTLEHYYPTDSTSRTEDMLAPSLRFGSKFGGIEYGGSSFFDNMKKEHAEYRCASYQEDGFPAGRWRLPTKGEILFIAQLSANGLFEEPLFSNVTYWSANGAVRVNNGTATFDKNATTALLRCVYDSWYWGDEQYSPRNKFFWGDKER